MRSKISYPYLVKFNLTMGFLHLIQGLLMLWLGLRLDNIKDFKLPLNLSYLSFDPFYQKLFLVTDEVARLPIAVIVSSFLLISALAHFIIVLNPKTYQNNLEKGINYYRWFEYAVSSSVMIVMIAMFFGIYDSIALLMIIGANATMNLLGLVMELVNQGKDKKDVRWSPFVVGSIVGIFPWIALVVALLASGAYGEIPWFVWAALVVYFVFFNSFPINMYLQYKKIGKWEDYLYGERGYILLSLFAKSALAWIVFFGTMQPA